MPIKKHIVQVEKDNKIQLPKSICDAVGISEGIALRIYSNKTGYQFICEVPSSVETLKLVEFYKEQNDKLQKRINELEAR